MQNDNGDVPDQTPFDIDSEILAPRILGLEHLALTPRRVEQRRLAAAMREVMDLLVSTTATTKDLAGAADDLEALADLLRTFPMGQTYQGFSESALSGATVSELGEPAPSGDGDTDGDPRQTWYAFFDHSPIIGLANPLSPPMSMQYSPERITAQVTFGAAFEGPPGCVHGGYIAAVFDELLGSAQSLSGTSGMTANLSVDYRRPTPLKTPIEMEAWLERRDGRKIYAKGVMHANGELTAEATGLFVSFDAESFARLVESRDDGA